MCISWDHSTILSCPTFIPTKNNQCSLKKNHETRRAVAIVETSRWSEVKRYTEKNETKQKQKLKQLLTINVFTGGNINYKYIEIDLYGVVVWLCADNPVMTEVGLRYGSYYAITF